MTIDSYKRSRRYDDAYIQRQRITDPTPCAIQPRDLAVVNDVRRYKFLTADQIRELWWPNASPRAAERRLLKLHQAGLIDRFRPLANRGSFPWTYQLADGGHELLKDAGAINQRDRFNKRQIYDYSYVTHDLQLNAWVLAYRRLLGNRLLSWEGETDILPPASAAGARPLRPDAILEIEGDDGNPRTFLVEYDRTGRPDKNYDKFARYGTFLERWWQDSHYGAREAPPYVLFICLTEIHRRRLMSTAHSQLPDGPDVLRALIFAVERDVYARDRHVDRLLAGTGGRAVLP